MQKFTPGPWRAEFGADAYFHISCADGLDLPDTKANARLLSAAPDLFAALTEIVAASDVYDESAAADKRCAVALKKARAALAKATGA